MALADEFWQMGQTSKALAGWEASLRLGSGDNATLQNVAVTFIGIYPARALALTDTAIARDPFSLGLWSIKAGAQIALRRYGDAAMSLAEAARLGGGVDPRRAILMLLTSNYAGADAEIRHMLLPHSRMALTACLLVRTGKPADADLLIAELLKMDDDLVGYWRAIALVARGRTADAIVSLERVIAAQSLGPANVLYAPLLDPLWPDPRFQALLARLFPADAIAARARLAGKG